MIVGGTALNFETRRVESQKEFTQLWEEVAYKILHSLRLSQSSVRLIPYYSSKESFGDMDILIRMGFGFPDNWTDRIVKEFLPKSTKKNGRCFSFDYKDFQIDLILCPEKEFDYSFRYFSYNDLGNFIGRVAHRLGFKHGHDGLWYVLRDKDNPDRTIKEILVTQNYESALEFLGFSSAKFFTCSFRTPENIFEYAASSKYFDPRQFLLVNRSYAARVRDNKRKMYHGMLEWIREKYPELTGEEEPLPVDRQEHLQRAFSAFPAFKEQYDLAAEEYRLQCLFKAKFNGDLVGKIFGLHGKELGEMMQILRLKIEVFNLRDFIINMPNEVLEDFYKLVLWRS